MAEHELPEDIERLRSEVNLLAAGDAEQKQRLSALIDRIEARVQEADAAERQPDLVADVRDAIAQFESQHPQLTAALDRILVTLSNMGI